MAPGFVNNKRKHDGEQNQFICPIVYTNELPTYPKDCKFLPCCQDIQEYCKEPVSIPKLDTCFLQNFKGLHELFTINLMDQLPYDELSENVHPMNPREADLLKDIQALDCDFARLQPSRAQECAQMFAKERVHPPRPRLQRSVAVPKAPFNLQPVSLVQQKEMIDGSFKDINKPLLRHPTNPRSNAYPVQIMSVFPDTDLQKYSFVQMSFDNPPQNTNQGLIRDCGSCLINFNFVQDIAESTEKLYVSDHRYKEEKADDSLERGEGLILREEKNAIFYVGVDKYIKLRRERPRPQASANKFLLVQRVTMD
ncbi:RNA polymerase II-associated factor 1 homolog isoform X2 [Drosophila sechellia]|uniref:RNA polymerase II-associated factor 1 homolog isoform X2 n=1 Tax=Drosophila sechellia TaxID=7238 RepID=UPI0013DE5AC8|nr:RNA polymerase II-associated factor 1 homolog isoform X2 [Drosophila sechellia]